MIRDGLNVSYSAAPHSVEIVGDELLVHVAPRDVSNRERQLDTGLFTWRFFSQQSGDAGSLAARSHESGVILVLPEGESEHTVYL
ncbi:hypothetical protein OKW30_000467 [Paraburkholderia sp. Clong3]|uniref:hypothetical protein n=1 Tax=unclassified Paraburkholderia TaxID=2615204 RepID=UPI001614FF0B|nr:MULTISPECIES: hypothetical protein [unclassified Paraburkholderia]MBB5467534.1 hypothetical protein [Paraburkholderia sp. CI2]MBC8736072.1 hypothetical protein [Paraburkholderia sp. UCT31]